MIPDLYKKLHISRINSELTRSQVSQRIGVSESIIGLYESGNRQPSLENLVKLAKLYNVSIDYLLGNEINNNESLSLNGLTENQKRALIQTYKCFTELK